MSEQDDILAANAAYYEAFASADAEKMSRIWADQDVTCVHPGWPALVGRPAILQSYRNIFGNPNQERVEPHNAMAMVFGDEGRVICIELIGDAHALAATNWFRRVSEGLARCSSVTLPAIQPRPTSCQRIDRA